MGKSRNKKAACIAVIILAMLLCSACFVHFKEKRDQEVKHFTAFFAVPSPIEKEVKGNRIRNKVTELTKTDVEVSWLTSQTVSEKIENMIRTGEYPDFILGSESTNALVEAKALVPLEGYLKDYPNLQQYLTRQQWESLRKEDGHIYFIPPFGVVRGHDTATVNAGEAFWVQKRVLEWAGFPKLKTLDEYFGLLTAYLEEYPTTDGEKNIGFEILCDDWRYFCLENPPMFLAGYPNDGCAIVDPETQKASVYDTIPEARQYYQKLCEMYHRGVIDPETFTLSYSQYQERISSGNVLGFVDQYWQILGAQNSLYASGREERTYVPFPITANEGIEGQYNCMDASLNTGEGLGISVDCKDVEGALYFLDQLLSPEIMVLRNWGEEGKDYLVGEDGIFYRTEEQRKLRENGEYLNENFYDFAYFPSYFGMLDDGINTVAPEEQPGEYYARLSEYDKGILDAYGCHTWKEFMGKETQGKPWFPLYSCTADWPIGSSYGKALEDMERLKRRWLPKIIMSPIESFGENWDAYMQEYQENIDIEAYESQLNQEIQKKLRQNAAVPEDGGILP